MESDRYLQSILDFIASGLHSTSDRSRQLLLLLVLLEEIYETGNAIPLLTEKKSTIQSIIKWIWPISFPVEGACRTSHLR